MISLSPSVIYNASYSLLMLIKIVIFSCEKELEIYSKTCVKRPFSKRPKIGFQDQLSLNEGQKYNRMIQGEHSSSILSTFIQVPCVKIFVLLILKWPCNTGLTVLPFICSLESRPCT